MTENETNGVGRGGEIPDLDEGERDRLDRATVDRRRLYDDVDFNYERFERRKKYFGAPKSGKSYAQIKAKLSAEHALEDLYDNEFPIDDPPPSWERYEAEWAVRHLAKPVRSLAGPETEPAEEDIELAVESIELMATYGQLAEMYIASLTELDLPVRVRREAIETLGELREGEGESLSLREALARWLSP